MWFSVAGACVAVQLFRAVSDLSISVEDEAPVAHRHVETFGKYVERLENRALSGQSGRPRCADGKAAPREAQAEPRSAVQAQGRCRAQVQGRRCRA
jgi:hypothetical protein